MPTLRRIAGLIGWLSGSLAGVTAILYALGFVATLTHLRLLGLSPTLVPHEPTVQVARGGMALVHAFVLLVPTLAVLVVATALGSLAWRLFRGERPATAAEATPRPVREALLAGLLIAATWAAVLAGLLGGLRPALAAGDLLYRDLGALCAEGTEIVTALLRQDREALGTRHVMVTAAALVALAAAWSCARIGIVRRAPARSLLLLLPAVALALLLLPMSYGVFVLRGEWSPVTVRLADGETLGGTAAGETAKENEADALLIRNATDGVLVWLTGDRSLRWIDRRGVDWMALGRPRPVLETLAPGACPPPATD
ncbi:MAG: hypothetical protein RID91_06770 [Azospirillaceae bacterium]